MADPLIVTPHERGVTRVFAVDLPKAGAEALREDGGAAISTALGSGPLDMAHVELFPVSDLGPLALSDYLIAGAGLPKEAILAERSDLDALTGHVLILHSRAFQGQPADLRPKPPLRWVATHALPSIAVPMTPLRSDGATGVLSAGAGPETESAGIPLWVWAVVAAVAVVIIGIVVLL
jgi:hypothetical protein